MNLFVLEALFIGAKEGFKLSLCVYLVLLFLRRSGHEHLKHAVAAGVFVVFLASFAAMTFPVTSETRSIIVKMTGYVFGLFYLFAIGALFHSAGTDLLGPLKGIRNSHPALYVITFILTLFYFVPDMSGSSLYVTDISSMSGAAAVVISAAGIGFMLSIALSLLSGRAAKFDLSGMFGFPQLLLSLAMIKLISGGVRGFAEFSLIPAVKAGLMKLVHDVVHQTFVLVLVPDHPVLSATTWNFIGFLFGETAGSWLSLILLVLPLGIFIVKHFNESISVPEAIGVPARQRIFIRAVRDQRILKSIPVVIFLALIASMWFAKKSESVSRLYIPEVRQIVPDGGFVVVPLQSPMDDLRDGKIHKFNISVDAGQIRLLIMKKPDGTLGVCLDACEICPPDGYGQSKDHVVCIYCKTPIPFESIGKPGGCNPIPVVALVTDKEIKIAVAEIAEKWKKVNTGAEK